MSGALFLSSRDMFGSRNGDAAQQAVTIAPSATPNDLAAVALVRTERLANMLRLFARLNDKGDELPGADELADLAYPMAEELVNLLRALLERTTGGARVAPVPSGGLSPTSASDPGARQWWLWAVFHAVDRLQDSGGSDGDEDDRNAAAWLCELGKALAGGLAAGVDDRDVAQRAAAARRGS